MWIIKAIARFLLDVLYIFIAIGILAYTFVSIGMIGSVILSIPLWYALSWVYSRIQNTGTDGT